MRWHLALILALPLAAQGRELSAQHIVQHPGRWSGEYSAALHDLITRLEADPDSPLAAIALVELEDLARLADEPLDPARLQALAARTHGALASLRVRRLLVSAARRTRFSDEPYVLGLDVWPEFLSQWSVLGPFGPLDHPAPLHLGPEPGAPEQGVRVRHPSHFGPDLVWKPRPRVEGQLQVMPARGLPHPGDGLVYLRANVQLDGDAWLELLCPGEYQVWWNGVRVLDLPARGPGQNQEREQVLVAGSPGWNELLVRMENRPGTRLSARFIDLLSGLARVVPQRAASAEPCARPEFLEPSRSSQAADQGWAASPGRESLEAAVACLGYIAGGRADLALAALPTGPVDPARARAWTRVRFEALVHSTHLPSEAKRRAILEVEGDMLTTGGLLPEAQAQRVMRLIKEDRPLEGLAELEALEARVPANPNYALLRVMGLGELDGTGVLALNELRRLRARFPKSGQVVALLASSLESSGDGALALDAWGAALALAGGANDVQERGLGALARAGGEPLARARAWIEAWRADDAGLRRPRELYELVLAVSGDDLGLEALLRQELAAGLTRDTGARASLAGFLIARGRRGEARELLAEHLRREPGDHGARATLARLGGGHMAERFFAAFAPDRDEALAAAGSARDASIAEALDSGLVYLYPDGSSHERYHTITLALDRKGTELLHTEPVAEHARLARVLKGDGVVLEPSEVGGQWVMPFLEPGDGVELVWDQFTQGRPGTAPTIGWWRFASFEKPFVRSRYVIFVPDGLPGELRSFHFDGEHEQIDWEGGTVHVFLTRDRARQEEEPLRPSFEEILPWVQYGGDLPIDYIEAIWRDRDVQFSYLPADLALELAPLVSGLDSGGPPVARAQALFEAVTAHVLDFEGGALAAQVWPNRRGNPIFLLGALYELAGLEFEWAVLRRSVAPELDPEPAQAFEDLRGYDLPALRLAGESPTWVLAPAGRGMRFGAVPDNLAGAPVLVLAADGGRMEELPRDQLADSWDLDLEVAYDLQADGSAQVSGRARITTAQGPLMREQLSQASAVQRGGAARNLAGQMVPGLDLEQFDFPGLGDKGAAFEMTFTGRVPTFARERGGRYRVGLGIPPTGLATGLGAAQRRWPLALRVSRRDRVAVTIRGGQAWRVIAGPHAFHEQREGFLHELEVEETDGSWRAVRTLTLRGPVFAPNEVPAFLARESELERETARPVELEKVQ
jgi:hypothetical protein